MVRELVLASTDANHDGVNSEMAGPNTNVWLGFYNADLGRTIDAFCEVPDEKNDYCCVSPDTFGVAPSVRFISAIPVEPTSSVESASSVER
jgi:hypothetical protein